MEHVAESPFMFMISMIFEYLPVNDLIGPVWDQNKFSRLSYYASFLELMGIIFCWGENLPYGVALRNDFTLLVDNR